MSGHNTQKYLFDIIEAGERICSFVSGKDFDQYICDVLLQSAVERQFEIIGEALNQAVKLDPELGSQIILFRNFIIHPYALFHMRLSGMLSNHICLTSSQR